MEKCYKLKGRLEIFLKERGLWDDFISRLNERSLTFDECCSLFITNFETRYHKYAMKTMTSHYWIHSNDLRREAYYYFVSRYSSLPYKKEPDQWDNMWEE